jgi:hypothetical protein
MRRLGYALCAVGLLTALACGTKSAEPLPTVSPPGAKPAPTTVATSTGNPANVPLPDSSAPPGPPAHAGRYAEAKGVLHVHSVYSHDACDGHGLDDAGVPNAPCLADLRAAPCNVGLQFVNLTDHPAHMNEFEPKDNLLYDASKGDELVFDTDGVSPIGNYVKCPDGRKVLFTFGYEGTHTMPLMFKRHPTRYDSYTTDRALSDVQSLVTDLKSAGALVALAHSEESDIDANLIVQGGADLMEWYNPHGNFKKTLGTDKVSGNPLTLLSFFSGIEDFLAGSTSGANPDLVYLKLLQQWPTEGFAKWREVQRSRFVPGVLGTDVHEDISIDPVCTGATQLLCAGAANGKLAALALLAAGGQLVMSDQKRLDTYDRLLRWLHNRLLTNDVSPAGIRDALSHGRSYGIFSVFGDPTGFYFEGSAAGQPLDLGDEATGPVALTVKVPDAPAPITGGAQFDAVAAKNAIVRAVLFHTDANGTTEVASANTLGGLIQKTVTAPGSYHVEVWIKPKHLLAPLGPQSALSDFEYLWFITNPIRVTK